MKSNIYISNIFTKHYVAAYRTVQEELLPMVLTEMLHQKQLDYYKFQTLNC